MTHSADRRWLPLNALRAFEGVAKYNSFTAAASALLISPSALSRHVAGLEKYLGTALFDRRPNALVLTKAGKKLLPVVMRSLDQLGHAIDVRRSESSSIRTLRVQMPPSFAAKIVAPYLGQFRRAAPDVEIDLLSLCEVGLPPIDLDVAVVYSKPRVVDMVADLLWIERFSLLCSPGVACRFADGDLVGLLNSTELIHVRVAELPRYHVWNLFAREHDIPTSTVERGLIFDTAVLAAEYLLSGEGIALLDQRLFAEHLRNGQLTRPIETEFDIGYGYYVLTHADALTDEAVASFRAWLIGQATIEGYGPTRLSTTQAKTNAGVG